MGNNTVAFMLNDMAAEIERDPKAVHDLLRQSLASGQGGSMGQALRVLPSVHADSDQIIMAGGNRITTIAFARGCEHTDEALMRLLARRLGYRLSKG